MSEHNAVALDSQPAAAPVRNVVAMKRFELRTVLDGGKLCAAVVSPPRKQEPKPKCKPPQEPTGEPFASLPGGSREVWEHCSDSLYVAEQSSTNESKQMFVFTREMMRFTWTPEWRDDPDRIADLLEKIHRQ